MHTSPQTGWHKGMGLNKAPAVSLRLSKSVQEEEPRFYHVFRNLFDCVDADDSGGLSFSELETICVNYPEIAALLGLRQKRGLTDAAFEIGKDTVEEDMNCEDFLALIKSHQANRRVELTPRTRQKFVFDLISRTAGEITLPSIANACIQKPAIAKLLVSVGTAASERRAVEMLNVFTLISKRGQSRFSSESASFEEFCSLINCVRGVSVTCYKKLTGKTCTTLVEEYLTFVAECVAKRDPSSVGALANEYEHVPKEQTTSFEHISRSRSDRRPGNAVCASQRPGVDTGDLPKLFTDLKFVGGDLLVDKSGKLVRGLNGEVLRRNELVCRFDKKLMKNVEGKAITRKDLSYGEDQDHTLMCNVKAVLSPDNKPLTREHTRVYMDGKPVLDADNKIALRSTEFEVAPEKEIVVEPEVLQDDSQIGGTGESEVTEARAAQDELETMQAVEIVQISEPEITPDEHGTM